MREGKQEKGAALQDLVLIHFNTVKLKTQSKAHLLEQVKEMLLLARKIKLNLDQVLITKFQLLNRINKIKEDIHLVREEKKEKALVQGLAHTIFNTAKPKILYRAHPLEQARELK